jgi:hypothetical protein
LAFDLSQTHGGEFRRCRSGPKRGRVEANSRRPRGIGGVRRPLRSNVSFDVQITNECATPLRLKRSLKENNFAPIFVEVRRKTAPTRRQEPAAGHGEPPLACPPRGGRPCPLSTCEGNHSHLDVKNLAASQGDPHSPNPSSSIVFVIVVKSMYWRDGGVKGSFTSCACLRVIRYHG